MTRSAKEPRASKDTTPLSDRARKIGERPETFTVELTEAQVTEEKTNVVELLDRRENLLAASKSLGAEYKAKIKTVEAKISAAQRAASSRRRDVEVLVIEWLTSDNQVVRVRSDNGEALGRRTATADELQETLFDDGNSEFPTSAEVFGDGPS